MKILLIEISCPDVRAFGVRSLASYIRDKGHDVHILFLPPLFEQLRGESGIVHSYSERLIREALDLALDFDIIGISVLTYYFDRAVQLTTAFHEKLGVPVIWGGIHASTRPRECLEFADYVCIGEGEGAIVELLDRLEQQENTASILNIWSKTDGQINENLVRPLEYNLDVLPFPDLEIQFHYSYNVFSDEIQQMDEKLMKFFSLASPMNLKGIFYQYKTMSSRGCPHNCAFCCNSIYRTMYGNKGYLRWRSTEKIFEELEYALNRIPFFNAIMFFDDSFFAMPLKQMKQFAEEYKSRIGLPFAAQSSPQTTTREKMECLVDAGMLYLEMGIQTGSARINSMYHRKQSNQKVIEAATVISQFTDRILPPDYHLILDNNWESEKDVLETLDLVIQLPRPFGLKPSSLVLYPGTELYDIALSEGLISDEKKDVYRKAFGAPKTTWLNLLILMLDYPFVPVVVIRFLKRPFFISFFKRHELTPFLSLVRWTLHQTNRALRKFRRLSHSLFSHNVRKFGRLTL